MYANVSTVLISEAVTVHRVDRALMDSDRRGVLLESDRQTSAEPSALYEISTLVLAVYPMRANFEEKEPNYLEKDHGLAGSKSYYSFVHSHNLHSNPDSFLPAPSGLLPTKEGRTRYRDSL
jgi:hypothetical protein